MTAASELLTYVRRASAEARNAPAAVAALAYDVLARQAEARTLFAGREFVEARAAAHHVDREAAELPSGNVLDVLGRGPSNDLERALLLGLAFRALDARIAEDGAEAAARFVRQADWLEVGVGQPVYAFVDEALPKSSAATFWETVGTEALAADDRSAVSRAKNAVRIAALAASSSDAAKHALERLCGAGDPATRALAHALGHVSPSSEPARAIEGRASRPRPRGVWAVLRWISGVAIAMWIARALGLVIGLRRRARVTLVRDGLKIERDVGWLGKRSRARISIHALGDLVRAEAISRYGAAGSLVGAIALAAGILVGGVMLVDAARTGETFLMLVGAVAIGLGAGLDFVLDVLLPSRRARCRVELVFRDRTAIALEGVSEDDARALLVRLEERAAR